MMSVLLLLGTAGGVLVVRRARRPRPGGPAATRDLATLAMHLARGVRAGLTTAEVLEMCQVRLCGPTGAEVARVRADMDRGQSFDSAISRHHTYWLKTH